MKSQVTKAALVLLPTLLFSSQIFACQTGASLNEQQEIQMNSKAVKAKNPTAYDLRTGRCEAVSSAHGDGAVMNFLPVDEEWQGLYEEYRAKGEAPLQALRHVYKFMAGARV